MILLLINILHHLGWSREQFEKYLKGAIYVMLLGTNSTLKLKNFYSPVLLHA